MQVSKKLDFVSSCLLLLPTAYCFSPATAKRNSSKNTPAWKKRKAVGSEQ